MNRQVAEAKIKKVFRTFGAQPSVKSAAKGKVYELFCLAKTLEFLDNHGVQISYKGPRSAVFKAAPGIIKSADPHFELSHNGQDLELFVNIEFQSMSTTIGNVTDRSKQHELDIIIVDSGVRGRPAHDQITLGIECKAVANFGKSILKEVLGIRRELSLLQPDYSKLHDFLGQTVTIQAAPASCYWVRYVDKKNGDQYAAGAAQYGIDFDAWVP